VFLEPAVSCSSAGRCRKIMPVAPFFVVERSRDRYTGVAMAAGQLRRDDFSTAGFL